MSIAKIADKYIGRNGEAPSKKRSSGIDDLVALTSFLGNCPSDEMRGGVTAAEAFGAFSRFSGISETKLRFIVEPFGPQERSSEIDKLMLERRVP